MPAMQETRVQSLGWEDLMENDYPFQYFYLEDSMDRGAWWATVCGVTERYNEHTHTHHKRIKK